MIDQTSRNPLQKCVLPALLLMLPALSALSFTIPGDPADGRIDATAGTVTTAGQELAIGHRGTGGTQLVTAIYFFALPDLASSADVNNASLQFTFTDRSGSFSNNPANADVWGLGYVATPTINPAWHLLGNTDVRTGTTLGTGIGANPVVKLADNFLDDQSNDPVGEAYRLALPADSVKQFIGLLYDQGAVAGDYAVIRVNVDAPTSTVNRGFDLASANATNETTRPVLNINQSTTLVIDPFTDGDRANGADPLDTDWYTVTSQLDLTIVDDTGGINQGNTLNVQMNNTGRKFVAGFPSITLANPGDFIKFTCLFRPTFFLASDEGFRWGVLGSGGSPIVGDTSSSPTNYGGYMIRMSTDAVGDLATINTAAGDSFLGSSSGAGSDFLDRKDGAIPVNNTAVIYSLDYTITRASSTQMTTRIILNNVTLNGMDPGADPDPPDWAFVDTFDALGIGAGNSSSSIDFRLDNVRVETSVPLVQIVPYVQVQSNVIEVRVETQPDIRYSLQQATGLVSSNWTNSGYILTGDGTPLRVYDPNATQPTKSYRMESQ